MIRIALCDDEITARDELRFGLEKILYEESEKLFTNLHLEKAPHTG